ncbi:hypothetical protein ACSEQ3_01650 [Pseudomonas aeruginosa]
MSFERIASAVAASGVNHIAVMDDVFDIPPVTPNEYGSWLEFFDSAMGSTVAKEVGVSDADLASACAFLRSEHDDEDALLDVIGKIYLRYTETFDSRFDPFEFFTGKKGGNLAALKPILTLINKLAGVKVTRIGSVANVIEFDGEPEVVFADYYLDPSLSATENAVGAKGAQAIHNSLDRLNLIFKSAKVAPAIILMSSHDQARQESERYRTSARLEKGHLFASRFAFVHKGEVSLENDSLTIDRLALDSLLELFGSYIFGRSLSVSLNTWGESARSAVDNLQEGMKELGLNDLAYLVRFRLAKEGLSLIEYLDWLLGEALVEKIGSNFDLGVKDCQYSKDLESGCDTVIGAFDGATERVAELYNSARVRSSRVSVLPNYKLGDIYVDAYTSNGEASMPSSVIAIMNPDCDLMRRKDGSRTATQLLVVSGELKGLNGLKSSIKDYLVIDSKPYNIKWNLKSFRTIPFGASAPQENTSSELYRYIGTLKSVYAQELQQDLLSDIGRVGVPVPPSLAVMASFKVKWRDKAGKWTEVEGIDNNTCYFVPSRGGSDAVRTVFPKSFIEVLVNKLGDIDPNSLEARWVKDREAQSKDGGETLINALVKDGVSFNCKPIHGVSVIGGDKPAGEAKEAWAVIQVLLS